MIKETLPEEDLNKKLKKIRQVEEGEKSIEDIEERTALPEEKTEEEIYSMPGVEPGKGLEPLKKYLKEKRAKEKGH